MLIPIGVLSPASRRPAPCTTASVVQRMVLSPLLMSTRMLWRTPCLDTTVLSPALILIPRSTVLSLVMRRAISFFGTSIRSDIWRSMQSLLALMACRLNPNNSAIVHCQFYKEGRNLYIATKSGTVYVYDTLSLETLFVYSVNKPIAGIYINALDNIMICCETGDVFFFKQSQQSCYKHYYLNRVCSFSIES